MSLIFYLAVIPPLYLMYRIYQMDKVEKEPVRLVAKVFVFGMLCCIPAGIAESIGISLLQNLVDPNGLLFVALENFLVVALAEEGFKLLVTRHFTWKNPSFNYLFDGIVYCAAASLGFACFENIFYVYGGAYEALFIAATRAVTSIPGHCTFGIMMGYYYGIAKLLTERGDLDQGRAYLRKALWVPVFLHGLYDFILSTELELLIVAFIAYVIWLDVHAVKKARELAQADQAFRPEEDGGLNW
jgi:RsiW-degrading membrane proteinase PrsW (M82 family)